MKPVKKFKRKIIRLFFREQWSILICDKEGTPLKEILPPPDRIWADPFPVYHKGRYYLFLEEQIIGRRGTLGCIEIKDDLSYGPVTPILTLPHHLSWPNVFPVSRNGKTTWYMVPESNQAGTIECYRAKKFPYEWELETTLLTGVRAADTEIYNDGKNWYLFTSLKSGKTGMNNSLFAFHSSRFPSTAWEPFPDNPVIQGIENSRMAGKIYRDEKTGFLVRPAQYSKGDYGVRVQLNRIESLDLSGYHETPLRTVRPERKMRAVCTHTWNPCGEYIFRDIKRRYFDPLWRFKNKGTNA